MGVIIALLFKWDLQTENALLGERRTKLGKIIKEVFKKKNYLASVVADAKIFS